jgi:predicted nucleic-acid-binding protein
MTKVFIDSNVFIRFLTQDDPQKALDCTEFFELIEQGLLRPYISNVIVLEIQFVLVRLYKFPKEKVMDDIATLLSLRNLTLIEKTDTHKALELYKKHTVKYADCLISTQIPKGVRLVSYDEEFSKIKISKLVPVDLL